VKIPFDRNEGCSAELIAQKIRIYRAVWEPRKSRKGQLFFSATDFAVTSFNKVVFGGIRIGSSPVES